MPGGRSKALFPHPAEHAFLKDNYLVKLGMHPRVNVKNESPGLKADYMFCRHTIVSGGLWSLQGMV